MTPQTTRKHLESEIDTIHGTAELRRQVKALEDEKLKVIEDEVNSILAVYNTVVPDQSRRIFRKLLKKYDLESILNGIEISKAKYLPDTEQFLAKISGIVYLSSLSKLDQEIHYLSSVIAQHFNRPKWNVKTLLDQYAAVLRNYWQYSDEQIIFDLRDEVHSQYKETLSIYEFRSLIYAWINHIKED